MAVISRRIFGRSSNSSYKENMKYKFLITLNYILATYWKLSIGNW